jgi:hypothetical protein
MKPRNVVILLAALAFLAKLFCAATTVGSSDAVTFWWFARYTRQFGLMNMYRAAPEFNHTPLVGWFVEYIQIAAKHTDPAFFTLFLRLPGIFADLASVFGLLWLREKTGRPSWWVLGLFAASPVSFMVSGFHGNVDSLMVAGLLFAALACVADRPGLSGLFFGLSCNIKIIPLLLVPALLFYWLGRGRAVRFSLPALATILIGWCVPLFVLPTTFLKDVLGYSSVWGTWGITYLLRITNLPAFQGILFAGKTPAENIITTVLKLSIIAAVLLWAWSRRRTSSTEIFKTLAVSYSVFFLLAPGFGAQYLLWPAPFFVAAAESWYLALTVTSSVGLFVFYTAACDNHLPWDKAIHVNETAAQWAPWLVLPWLIFAGYVACSARFGIAIPAFFSRDRQVILETPREA